MPLQETAILEDGISIRTRAEADIQPAGFGNNFGNSFGR